MSNRPKNEHLTDANGAPHYAIEHSGVVNHSTKPTSYEVRDATGAGRKVTVAPGKVLRFRANETLIKR